MQFEDFKMLLDEQVPNTVLGENLESTPQALVVDSLKIRAVCSFLLSNENTYFDSLSCLTGIDNGSESGTIEVIYHLYSIPYDHHLTLITELSRENPKVDSVADIWRGANWHEREAYDLLGIEFTNHPDLRRILLPDDWEGFPLRKDYKEQEHYHDIKVKY